MESASKWNSSDFKERVAQAEAQLRPMLKEMTTVGIVRRINVAASLKVQIVTLRDSIERFFDESQRIMVEADGESRQDFQNLLSTYKELASKLMREAKRFVKDRETRKALVDQARLLLLVVMRVLVLVEMLDDQVLLTNLSKLANCLQRIKSAKSQNELDERYKEYECCLAEVLIYSEKRIKKCTNQLKSARATLKSQSLKLYTSIKTFLSHPNLELARKLQEEINNDLQNAINELNNGLIENERQSHIVSDNTSVKIARQFDELIVRISEDFTEPKTKVDLVNQLDKILNQGEALSSVIDKEGIKNECEKLRKDLLDLISETDKESQLEVSKNKVISSIKDLKKRLSRLIVDGMCNNFPNATRILDDLTRSASEESIEKFLTHSQQLYDLAMLASSLSTSDDDNSAAPLVPELGRRVLKSAAQTAAAARIPLENLQPFKVDWQRHVGLLVDALYDITSLNEFLCVSEMYIFEDVNRTLAAIGEGKFDDALRAADFVRARFKCFCEAIRGELENYEMCELSKQILAQISAFKNDIVMHFYQSVQEAASALRAQQDPRENDLIESARALYDGVRDLRTKMLTAIKDDVADEEVNDSDNGEKIVDQEQQKELDSLRREKAHFDQEVLKWDDKGNDIVLLAKRICLITMDMTDFTLGKGVLESPKEVLAAAKKITEYGSQLEKLAKEIAAQCPESPAKSDLENYLKNLPFYCNQLNITSKVQETIISAESALNLIINAKNLMGTVISIVKSSYVASTKYQNKKSLFQWKMKAPEKKPLLTRNLTLGEVLVRKDSLAAKRKEEVEPIKVLSEFI